MSSLRSISATEFERWQPALKVIAHEHARKFAVVTLESGLEFALSWRSDLIDPVILPGSPSEIWMGVDQRLACVDKVGHIMLSLALASSLLTVKRLSQCVAVVCETEVIAFNADHTIRRIYGLPDIPSDITEGNGKLVVSFEDGTSLSVA